MSVLHSTAIFLTSEPLIGNSSHFHASTPLNIKLFHWACPCSQGHVNSLRYMRLLVTDIQPTPETGATNLEIFRIREKNIPVDIVEVWRLTEVCRLVSWHPTSPHADVESVSKFSHTLCLHPFALGERFRAWLPLGDQGVSQLSSGDFWPKIHPNFCLRHRFSLLTSDDSGHHPKMCLGLNLNLTAVNLRKMWDVQKELVRNFGE